MVLESHEALAEATECDVILMEGAGSCTELNLMDRDIVNLPLVRALGCPWLLVANIDCGGVFAQIVGTQMCVSKRDWSLCVGIIVNKLRGEAKYFEPGPKMIEDMVGKPVFVVPFLPDLHLPEEDGVGIERRLAWESSGHLHPDDDQNEIHKKPVVVVVAYPHTAISDDICPLEADPRFQVQWRRRRLPRPYPHTTSVILPGSRLTLMDLKWLHDSGWAAFLRNHVAAGGSILGLCGGYQMLGWSVDDPHAVEGQAGSRKGLGLLPIRTKLALPELKVVSPRFGRLHPNAPAVRGFELHCGQSQIVMSLGDSLRDQVHPLLVFEDGNPEGMRARRVRGTYLHGILWSPEARVACLVPDKKQFPILKNITVQDRLDRLAEHLESCGLDFATLRGMISSHRMPNLDSNTA
jgi:adenosylcobyric acid synthase